MIGFQWARNIDRRNLAVLINVISLTSLVLDKQRPFVDANFSLTAFTWS
jgi:hypothetical protein